MQWMQRLRMSVILFVLYCYNFVLHIHMRRLIMELVKDINEIIEKIRLGLSEQVGADK